MNWFNLLSLSGAIYCFVISSYVYFSITKNSIHKWYCLAIFSIGFWTFDSFFMNFVQAKGILFIFHKVFYIGAIVSQFAFINWARAIRKNIKRWENWIVNSLIFWSIIVIILNFTNKFIEGTSGGHFYFSNFIQAGNLYFTFVLLVIGCSTFGTYLIFRKMQESEGQERAQLLYIIIGTVSMYTAGYIYFCYVYKLIVYPVADFFVVVCNSIITYAIVRHQLMDIEVIIRRAAVFAGLFASVYLVFAFFALLGQLFFEKFITTNRWIAMIPSVVVVTFMLRPLENFFVRVTDKFLFQKKYDYKELLKTFTGEVLTVLDLSKLVNVTTENLNKIIRLESCAVLIHDKDKDNYPISASLGLKEPNQIFTKDSHLINYLLKTHHHLIKDKTIANLPDTGTIKEDLKRLNAELVIPIVLHDDLMGALTLGRKKSGEDFTQDDLDILLPLSQTLAVAISNAQYFFELTKTQQEAAQREKMAVIGTLAAGINHEICNPLGIARGQSEAFLLNKRDGIFDGKPESEQLKEAADILQLVIKEVDRATAITKKLSTFAKPSKGEITDDVDIAKEVDEVLALIGYELRLDKIEFVKNVPTALPHIRADKKQIQEILFNLIRNAAQAISESGKITVSAYEQNSKVLIDIADTGCGIPEDKLGMIFNPFYTTKEPGKGTGLGLFIVRQVVERNKGKISLKSKVNEGTTFTLEFPVTN